MSMNRPFPKHLGHYVRVGVAAFFTCIAVWETFENGIQSNHVQIWWAAASMWIVAVATETVMIGRQRNDDPGGNSGDN